MSPKDWVRQKWWRSERMEREVKGGQTSSRDTKRSWRNFHDRRHQVITFPENKDVKTEEV